MKNSRVSNHQGREGGMEGVGGRDKENRGSGDRATLEGRED